MPAASSKVNRWIIDTGASNHMVKRSKVESSKIYKSSKVLRINIANGRVDVSDRAYIFVPTLDDYVEAIVLSETPAAISVGRLISAGYLFIWELETPAFKDPNGNEIPVFVVNDVPYIYHDFSNEACVGEVEDSVADEEPPPNPGDWVDSRSQLVMTFDATGRRRGRPLKRENRRVNKKWIEPFWRTGQYSQEETAHSPEAGKITWFRRDQVRVPRKTRPGRL